MKKCLMLAVALAAGSAFAQTSGAKISLADARSKIDQVVAAPEKMTELMKQLAAEDQTAFLADVNSAIAGMPGSPEERSAVFLNVNNAAVRSAAPGNAGAVIAEVFATVSPEALTVICERFAADLLNRAGNPNVTISDERFLNVSTNLMVKVNERCEKTDNGSPRAAFAIVMLVLASHGSPADLADTLIDMLLHDDAKDMARSEWIPAALGLNGREKSYEPLLASANAGLRPDLAAVLTIAGPQYAAAVLADVSGKNAEAGNFIQNQTPVLDAVQNVLVRQAPNFGNDKIGGAAEAGGAVIGAVIEGGAVPGEPPKEDTRPNPLNPNPKDPDPVGPKPYLPFQNF